MPLIDQPVLGGSFVGRPADVASQGLNMLAPGYQPAEAQHVHSDIGSERLLFSATLNMNVTADQPLTLARSALPATWLYTRIRVYSPSVSLTTAAGGIYTGTGRTGNILVAASQTYTALSNALAGLDLTLTATGLGVQTAAPIFALTTAQGSAAAALIAVFGVPMS